MHKYSTAEQVSYVAYTGFFCSYVLCLNGAVGYIFSPMYVLFLRRVIGFCCKLAMLYILRSPKNFSVCIQSKLLFLATGNVQHVEIKLPQSVP